MLNDKLLYIIKILLLIILPISAIIVMLFLLLIKSYNYIIIGAYIGIPILITPIIWKKVSIKYEFNINYNKMLIKILLILYFILFSLATYMVYQSDIRPFVYFFIISSMVIIVFFEIYYCNDEWKMMHYFILFQCSIILIHLLLSVTLNYYYFISRTDPIIHASYIENILYNSHLNKDILNIYYDHPLWHILCVGVINLINVSFPTHKIMFFTNGMIYFIVPFLVYVTSQKVINNKKISLFAALFSSFYPEIISYGMASISRSVVIVFFILLTSLLIKSGDNKKKYVLSLALILPIIMYHPASTPYIITILVLLYLACTYIYKNKLFPFSYIYLFCIINIVYWIFRSGMTFEAIISGFRLNAPASNNIIVGGTSFTEFVNLVQYSPMILFIIFSFLLIYTYKKDNKLSLVFSIIGLISIILSFPGPLLLINFFSENMNLGRYGSYLLIFIIIPSAYGAYMLYVNISNKYKFVLVIVMYLMIFLSVSNDYVSSDNPLIKRPFYTYYLNESEIVAYNNIPSFSSGKILSDYVTIRYCGVHPELKNKYHILEVFQESNEILISSRDDIILVRTKELSGRPLKIYYSNNNMFVTNPPWSSEESLDYIYYDNIIYSLYIINRIYDSNTVQGYIDKY